MPRTHPHRLPVITACIALAVALSACAPDPASDSAARTDAPSSTQTVAEACTAVRTGVADATAQLQQLDAADPQAAVTAMGDVAAELGAAASAVQNADVAGILPDLQSGFTAAAESLQKIASGDLSQVPALQQSTTDIQDALTRLSKVCNAE